MCACVSMYGMLFEVDVVLIVIIKTESDMGEVAEEVTV